MCSHYPNGKRIRRSARKVLDSAKTLGILGILGNIKKTSMLCLVATSMLCIVAIYIYAKYMCIVATLQLYMRSVYAL